MPPPRPETQASLAAGGRHLRFAVTLLQQVPEQTANASDDWVLVVAFYAAVHVMNAWRWERRQQQPRTHNDRRNLIRAEPALQPVKRAFQQLRNQSEQTRYSPTFRATRTDAVVTINRAQRINDYVRQDVQVP